MDYRKFYKDYYKIDFGKEYEVHHIDLDRNNNDISNLLLLPKELHKRYHKTIMKLTRTDNYNEKILKLNITSNFSINANIEVIVMIGNILMEFKIFEDFKYENYRSEFLPNRFINGIELLENKNEQ